VSQILKSHEIRHLLETAIDEATGDTVTLGKAEAKKIRDYIRANQWAANQLRYREEQLMGYLEHNIQLARQSGRLHPETLAWLQKTDHLVAPKRARKKRPAF
jgi:hypothetical protein